MNLDGRLKSHKEPKLEWTDCPKCKIGKVPTNMHAYWHSQDHSESIFNGLSYKCTHCGQERMYNPTFDITVIL